MYSTEENADRHRPGADRTEPDRLQGAEDDPNDLREANENIRQAQGEESESPANSRIGNRPRFDRDR